MTIDLAPYLRRIGLQAPPAPTLAGLDLLVRHHSRAIPFENIDVLAGRVPALDQQALENKLVHSRRGGYCFEQNRLFMACMQALGFAVQALEARVRTGVAADAATARTHMALRVTVLGEAYLADVGFGSLAPVSALRFSSRAEQDSGRGVYRFVDVAAGVLLQARTHGGWSDCYCIGVDEPNPIDFEMANWFVATHPQSFLGQNLLVARSVEAGRMTLFNRELSTQGSLDREPERRLLNSRAEMATVLGEGFGLELADRDLDALMTVVERRAAA